VVVACRMSSVPLMTMMMMEMVMMVNVCMLCEQVLQDVANVNVTIYFNCREKLSEMPLNR